MKKIISLVLALVMCLSLCACGKSEEVKAVEEKIASIGEVSIDKADIIQEVNQAYEALSDKDKEKVENFDILQKSTDALQKAMFTAIADKCKEMNAGSDLIAQSVIEVWENVGGEKFWTWYGSILKFKDESLANMDVNSVDSYDTDYWYLSMPAYALGKIKHTDDDMSAEERQAIVDTCTVLANTYYGIQEMNEQVNQDYSIYKDLFKDEYADECQFLREWYLASSVFVEFATNPTGNRNDYSTKLTEHNSTMYAFQKEADLMK